MKKILAICAVMVGLLLGGKAMACGGGASGRLGKLTVKKTYRTASAAAKGAAAYAMTKTVLGQDSSGPSIGAKAMQASLVKKTTKTQQFNVTVKNDPNGSYDGKARVSVLKLSPGKYEAKILGGKVDASW